MTSRKEIAARLREVWDCNGGFFMTTDTAVFQLSDVVGARGKTYEFFFNRLADLIDPTCEDVSEPPKDGFTPVPVFKCSECGCQHVSPKYVRYCPSCGARVVRDE